MFYCDSYVKLSTNANYGTGLRAAAARYQAIEGVSVNCCSTVGGISV